MLLGAVNVFVRYVLHTFDLQSEDPWENKAIYLRYVDIFIGECTDIRAYMQTYTRTHAQTHTFKMSCTLPVLRTTPTTLYTALPNILYSLMS